MRCSRIRSAWVGERPWRPWRFAGDGLDEVGGVAVDARATSTRPPGHLLTEIAVGAAATRHCRSVELDLDGVTFVDCAGLSALIRLRRDATREGRCVRIVRSSRSVDRLLKLTGIDARLRAEGQVTKSS